MSNKNTTIYKLFGDALDDLLLDRNLEQQWLAQRLETGEDQISRYINNKVTPGKRRRKDIGDLLGVEFSQNEKGDWLVKENPNVTEAISSLSQVMNESGVYTSRQPNLDEILRSLEFAQKMIQDAMKIVHKIKSDQHDSQ